MVNFESGWTKIWTALNGAFGNSLTTILAILGTALAAYAVFKFVSGKRKGSGGNPKELGWMLALAAVIIAPNTLFPLLLKFVGWVVNFVIRTLQGM